MNVELMKKRRKELGMTQQDLADRCGLSRVTILNYESGRFEPTTENAEVLSKVLKVSILELLKEPNFEEIQENFNDIIRQMKSSLKRNILYSLSRDKSFPNFKKDDPESLIKDKTIDNLIDFISNYLNCEIYHSSKFDKLIIKDISNKEMYMLDTINIILLVKSFLLSINTFLDTVRIDGTRVYGLDESLLFSQEKEFLKKQEKEIQKKIKKLLEENKEGGSDE